MQMVGRPTSENSDVAKSVGGTKAIDRALQVLSSFVTRPEQGITEIASLSKLSPSTVHRIVRALVQSGYLEQSAETERYHLGHAAHVLGQSARESWGFDRALPILERIASITGESVNMGVADGNEVVVILRVESVQPLRFDQPSGSRISMHCSSMGKSLLAFSDAPLPVLDFRSVTPTTITSLVDFEKDLAGVRERGYSIDDQESIPGVSCVGAAIRNADGVAVAAIAVQGPTVRMTPERIEAIGEQAIASANEIRETLGLDKLSDLQIG
ncbi:MAG: IclR family acetate operon transcriptional repressor [Verrucomicrobiales bacterium]|jgi:IclR family acetate operon transcriptional repressor